MSNIHGKKFTSGNAIQPLYTFEGFGLYWRDGLLSPCLMQDDGNWAPVYMVQNAGRYTISRHILLAGRSRLERLIVETTTRGTALITYQISGTHEGREGTWILMFNWDGSIEYPKERPPYKGPYFRADLGPGFSYAVVVVVIVAVIALLVKLLS